MYRFKLITVVALLALGLGTLPAFGDEGEETGGNGTEETTGGSDEFKFAQLFATEFGADPVVVQELHDLNLGNGTLFKLFLFAAATETDVASLLATLEVDPESGEYKFGWGMLKKSLTEDQLAGLDELTKNFGQMVSAANKKKHGDDHPGKGPGKDKNGDKNRGNGHGKNKHGQDG